MPLNVFICALKRPHLCPCALIRALLVQNHPVAAVAKRAKSIYAAWLPKVMANLDAVLVDHAHLERKAATSALSLERYQELFHRVADLNAIAIEELEHFQLVLDILGDRGVSFSHPISSPWISGLMGTIRKGRQEQVIDHLLCAAAGSVAAVRVGAIRAAVVASSAKEKSDGGGLTRAVV